MQLNSWKIEQHLIPLSWVLFFLYSEHGATVKKKKKRNMFASNFHKGGD